MGEPIGEAMVHENTILVTGISFQNALVCVQPKRGWVGANVMEPSVKFCTIHT